MDEYSVYVDLDKIEFRNLIFLSDKAASERKERAQRNRAGQSGTKPRFKLKAR